VTLRGHTSTVWSLALYDALIDETHSTGIGKEDIQGASYPNPNPNPNPNPSSNKLISCSDDRSLKLWQCCDMDTNCNHGQQIPDLSSLESWKCISTLKDIHRRAIYTIDIHSSTGMDVV
jgi:hypothetical protein